MIDQHIIDVLNELLGAEQSYLLPRLAESGIFVTQPSTKDHVVIERMTRGNARRREALASLIIESGGAPAPREADLESADLHFQQFDLILPRLLESTRAVAAKYVRAAGRVSAHMSAASLIAQHSAQHKDDIASLESMVAGATNATP